MPPIEDDGNKPAYSYAQMIGMAILRAPNRRLTLAQIYEFISNTWAYYREDTKQSWHNSIRHNLSLHKAFTKQERPKGDAGKGSYWVIEPEMAGQFIKDRNRRGNNMSQMTINSTSVQPPKLAQPLSDALTPNPFLLQTNLPPRPQTAPALPELSSDATLPASDPALVDQETAEAENSNIAQPKSSPPDAINSSPPILTSKHRRNPSSPTARIQRPSSSRQQKPASSRMDDSGYFSSLESSVLRPNKATVVLTSELDKEPRRRISGRAEEEIARIRSSSHDVTPSHSRFRNATANVGQSSSPVRVNSPSTRLNPVTPSVVFKKPMRPPPSISPNTQLSQHRRMMREFANSPLKSFGMCSDSDMYSPFKWATLTPAGGVQEDSFQIFTDNLLGLPPGTPLYASSPLKPSVARTTAGRANTSTNVLAEAMTNAHKLNAKTPTRGSLLRPGVRTTNFGSPVKGAMNNLTTLDDSGDLFDFNSYENHSDDGLDILQGFGKIGESSFQNIPGPLTTVAGKNDHIRRPSLGGRSFTSRF
jgi:forkhead transcription factor HCM1